MFLSLKDALFPPYLQFKLKKRKCRLDLSKTLLRGIIDRYQFNVEH